MLDVLVFVSVTDGVPVSEVVAVGLGVPDMLDVPVFVCVVDGVPDCVGEVVAVKEDPCDGVQVIAEELVKVSVLLGLGNKLGKNVGLIVGVSVTLMVGLDACVVTTGVCVLVNAMVVAIGVGDNEYVLVIVYDKLEYIDAVYCKEVGIGDSDLV